jgi:Tol biopolymer transport system component
VRIVFSPYRVVGALALGLTIMAAPAHSQQPPLDVFEASEDIGSPKNAGSTAFDAASQEFTLKGSGVNMWEGRDECQFVWKRMKGDFLIRAEAAFVGAGVEPHRKLGVMIRNSLEPDAPYVDAAVHGDGMTSLQFRRTAGGMTEQIFTPITGANVIQLGRKGNIYTLRVAWQGETFVSDAVAEVQLSDEVYVGLFVCAHNADIVEEGKFRNVRIVVPAADDFVPYRDYIGSNIEILDVATGRREIVYRSPESLQAPNWTTDGTALIYNSNGKLYRFEIASRTPTVINTGSATANNNDHVLTFDGKTLGISNHSPEDDGKSIIYTVPVEGGEPKRVTPLGHSYFHGFSPDGRELVFTGNRNDELDIYKISIDGGEEVRLTDAPGVDDGPEYTPDGKWIYFNSSRTGRMQIWRMTPSGHDQHKVTDDGLNNWFPHISPDGKQIVILSFGPDVDPADHPFYRQVYLRLMPIEGGPPKVIAYVYGGQGTINVPSWSPDGKRLAFVSNTAGN